MPSSQDLSSAFQPSSFSTEPTVSIGAEIELDGSTVIDLGVQHLFDQDNDDDTSGVWIGLTRRF